MPISTANAKRGSKEPLERLTDRIRESCLQSIKDGRKKALLALRKKRQGDHLGGSSALAVEEAGSSLQMRARGLIKAAVQREQLGGDTGVQELTGAGSMEPLGGGGDGGLLASIFGEDRLASQTSGGGFGLGRSRVEEGGVSFGGATLGAEGGSDDDDDDNDVWFDEADMEAALVGVEEALLLELQAQDEALMAEVEAWERASEGGAAAELVYDLEGLALAEEGAALEGGPLDPSRALLCPCCGRGWMVTSADGLRLACGGRAGGCGAALDLGFDGLTVGAWAERESARA